MTAWVSGAAYEPFIGRWSRAIARDFVAWLAPAPDGVWLDLGCGTGALTEALIAAGARAPFAVADARALPLRGDSHDAAASALALNFVPEPLRALGARGTVPRCGADGRREPGDRGAHGQGPAPGYVQSLGARRRTRLRDALRTDMARHADASGAITLSARAWAVRGRSPGTAR